MAKVSDLVARYNSSQRGEFGGGDYVSASSHNRATVMNRVSRYNATTIHKAIKPPTPVDLPAPSKDSLNKHYSSIDSDLSNSGRRAAPSSAGPSPAYHESHGTVWNTRPQQRPMQQIHYQDSGSLSDDAEEFEEPYGHSGRVKNVDASSSGSRARGSSYDDADSSTSDREVPEPYEVDRLARGASSASRGSSAGAVASSANTRYSYRPALTFDDMDDDIHPDRSASPASDSSSAHTAGSHRSSGRHAPSSAGEAGRAARGRADRYYREPSSSSTIRSSNSSSNPDASSGRLFNARNGLPADHQRGIASRDAPLDRYREDDVDYAVEQQASKRGSPVAGPRHSDSRRGIADDMHEDLHDELHEEEEEVQDDPSDNDSSDDDSPALFHIGRAPAALRSKPLPKAKVVIARRRPESVDFGVEGIPEVDPQRAAASTPAHEFENMLNSAPTRRLVTDYTDPMELRRGRVSLINLMSTNQEDDDDAERGDHNDNDHGGKDAADLGSNGAGHGSDQRKDAAARKNRAKNGEFMDADGLGRQIDVEEVYGQPSNKKSYKPALFAGRPGNGSKEDERANRHAAREEAINRRSSIVSGAIDRISIAADPFVDFITSANHVAAPARPRGKFSRFMHKIFGAKRRQAITG